MIEVGCVLALSGSRGLDLGLLTIDRAYEIVFLAPTRAGINGLDFEAHKMTAYPLPTDVLQNPIAMTDTLQNPILSTTISS